MSSVFERRGYLDGHLYFKRDRRGYSSLSKGINNINLNVKMCNLVYFIFQSNYL